MRRLRRRTGGTNARAFAQMANDPRVRSRLLERGLIIPDSTFFIGGYHNTCDDSMTWYDLDRIPIGLRETFEHIRTAIDCARIRSAHERCRRFASADLSLSFDDALRHVEGRAEDLSQTRPESIWNTIFLSPIRSATDAGPNCPTTSPRYWE